MAKWLSPAGSPIIGTLEHIPGIAAISDIGADGTPEYSGGTDVLWDAQTTVTRAGRLIFLDYDGAEWTFDQLVKEEEADDDA